jgi:hypothetical protein
LPTIRARKKGRPECNRWSQHETKKLTGDLMEKDGQCGGQVRLRKIAQSYLIIEGKKVRS